MPLEGIPVCPACRQAGGRQGTSITSSRPPKLLRPDEELNPDLILRTDLLYPLSYRGIAAGR